jgi:hypothetical protein
MGLPGASKIGREYGDISTPVSGMRDRLHDTARILTQRKMTKRKLVLTAASLLLGLFLCYAALFYLPAYSSKTRILRIATQDFAALEAGPVAENTIIEPYFDFLVTNRGYVRAGQEITASYRLGEGTHLQLIMEQCSGLVIVEIFSCKMINQEFSNIGERPIGEIGFIVEENGFYKFKEVVLQETTALPSFSVQWTRN